MATTMHAASARQVRPPRPEQGRGAHEKIGIWTDDIAGRYRRISVHQLCMVWWLFSAGHITKRQLRIYFAAAEMAERRRYMREERGRTPKYTRRELRALIGGRQSATADAALAADVKALARLGLVRMTAQAVTFAVSIDQIRLEDITGFWAFFDQIPNRSRSVPVPRRTCRAMAGGFPTAVMAMMIALMIRSLFWHRPDPETGQGGYRIDGRTKLSWVADVFGLSRRSVTDARRRLIELGWITPIDAPQWQLNKWGQRYAINVDTFGPEEPQGESASPQPENSGESASPCLNRSASLTGNLNTRIPAPMRAGPAGVSPRDKGGSRKRTDRKRREGQEPTINDITAEDLSDTRRLLELHRQAVERGDIAGSEARRFSFVALAERARAQGQSPPKLFAWLLRNQRFEFITQADEDAASARLREHRYGKPQRQQWGGSGVPSPPPMELTDDQRFVQACIRVAKQHGHADPFDLARLRGWTREKWDAEVEQYDRLQAARY